MIGYNLEAHVHPKMHLKINKFIYIQIQLKSRAPPLIPSGCLCPNYICKYAFSLCIVLNIDFGCMRIDS